MEESDNDIPVRRISSQKVRDDFRLARARKTKGDSWVRGTESGKFPLSAQGCGWLGGLFAVVLTVGTLWWGVPHVENKLEQRTLSELAGAGIEVGGLEVDFSWRDANITGLIAPEASADEISIILADVEGIRSVNVDLDLAESPTSTTVETPSDAVGPLSVIVQLQGDRLTLSGTVLSEDHRAALITAAGGALGVENVTDKLEISGLGADIDGADLRVESVAEVLRSIQSPTSGRIVLVDDSLSASLTVPSDENSKELLEAFVRSGLVGERQIEVDP